MRLVLLESPYAKPEPDTPEHPGYPGGSYQFVLYARRATRDSILRGEAPFTSHLLFTQSGILNDTDERERRMGINAGTMWLNVADKLVAYVDYGVSKGMAQRMERAAAMGLPIEYREIGK